MALTEHDKAFYGSMMIAKDRRTILGDQDLCSVILLKTLISSYEYARAQYNAGVEGYYEKAECINDKIKKLKKCEKICNYSQRLLLSYSCVEYVTPE